MSLHSPLENSTLTHPPAAPVRPPAAQNPASPVAPPAPTYAPAPGHVYYPQPASAVRSGKVPGAYALAVISTLVLPIIFGPLAIWMAHSAGKEGDPRAGTAKTVAICCMIGGMVLGAALAVSSI